MTRIETPRMQLRELTLDDADDLHAVLSDPVAMTHYPKPFDRAMTSGWIEWNLRNYSGHGFGLWAVIHKAEDQLIGDCGLTFQTVDGVEELEIGYHLLRRFWNQGLATEAAMACRDYAFDRLDRTRVIAWMHPDNVASRRVAEKVGMRVEQEMDQKQGTPSVVYAMTRNDRIAAQAR